MRIDIQSKSRSLLGVTDLTLAAKIKQGLTPALDSRSYESRLRLLLKTLNALRVSSLEVEPPPLIADAVDRIRAIHSFRLAIVGEESPKRLLLSVAFDGGWEPYMRRIWRDLGPLLDVIFCNCEDYLDSDSHDFPAYAGWVRSAQVDTEFFYNASGLTVNDLHYLRAKIASDLREPSKERRQASCEAILKQALPALTALYRLTDMYPPRSGAKDGKYLLRAARHLLRDLVGLRIEKAREKELTPTERAALTWFNNYKACPDQKPAKVEWDARKDPLRVQGGIVEPYTGATHACLLLVAFQDSAAARDMLEYLEPAIEQTSATAQDAAAAGPFVNLGFTFQGLAIAGVSEGTRDLLPFEFREGMAARASILGDLRCNHPINWCLPERNWRKRPQEDADRIELSSVHATVQYACRDDHAVGWQDLTEDENHPLRSEVERFADTLSDKGVRILSVQSMRRFLEPGNGLPRGHFDFADGISQPRLEMPQQKPAFMTGDLLLGYENSHGDPPLTGKLWDDSTFLVVRKLKQDVEALNEVLKMSGDAKGTRAKFMGRAGDGELLIKSIADRHGNDFDYSEDPEGEACPFQSHIRRANPRRPREDIPKVPRIMRRGMSYGPLGDKKAERGLFFMAYNASIAEQFEVIQAWLSGSNSSDQNTYSALRDPFVGVPQEGDPHTFVFHDVAYGAGEGDPISHARQRKLTVASLKESLAVIEQGGELPAEELRVAARAWRRLIGQQVVELSPDRPIVTLEWGLYAFVPSIKAIAELKDLAKAAAKIEAVKDKDDPKKKDRRAAELAKHVQMGAAVIAKLGRAEQVLGFASAADQWKIALEDISARMSGRSQAVWAAIRELHDGALRTPYGVLVCSKKLVNQVFDNGGQYYTVTGYAERMHESFGEIYLGKDDDGLSRSLGKGDDGLSRSNYRTEACPANKAIMNVSREAAFRSSFDHTQKALGSLVARDSTRRLQVKDIVDDILARISEEWFGVPDDKHVMRGSWHWDWKPEDHPTCPGHFHSPSRYMFQPNPGPQASRVGKEHGQALKAAIKAFVGAHRLARTEPEGELGRALFKGYSNEDKLASTLIGVMMGFLPTVDGNIRGTLFEWINDRSLWDQQLAYLADKTEGSLAKAYKVLMRPLKETLLLRPVPELVWRTAVERHSLGSVEVRPGDKIAVSIVSATQECLIDDDEDGLYIIFGGNRRKKSHPTHACPGYEMAIGVMLGMLAGLLGSTRLRPTMSPMELEVSLR